MRRFIKILRSKVHTMTADKTYESLSPDDVERRLGDPGFHVFDVNGRERYAEGHVPGARWADPYDLAPDVLPTDKAAPLLFYCHNEM